MVRSARGAFLAAAAALALSACGTGSPDPVSPSTGSTTGEPPHQSAYRAGYEVGEKVYDTSGKGAAVKEIVGGGCVDRALAAGVPEGARPAWVQGCKDGVSKTPPTPQGS